MYEETIALLSNKPLINAFIEEHGQDMLVTQFLATVTTAEELIENYEKIIAMQKRELSYFKRKYPHPYEDELND